MRWMALLLALTAVCAFFRLIPFERSDVAELAPARILCIDGSGDTTFVCTDGGISAEGTDLPEALDRLRRSAPGKLLLATVDDLVLISCTPDWDFLERSGIRPATSVCRAPAMPASVDELADYLHARRSSCTLGLLSDLPSHPVPRLFITENGMLLEAAHD